jgi:TctA family transporter
MVGLGVLGYIMRKMHFPMSPLILGFVLGEMLEQNLRRALSISNGNLAILWQSGSDQNAAGAGHRRAGGAAAAASAA